MTWKAILEKDRSKECIQQFVREIIERPETLNQLIDLLHENNRKSSSQFSAAWILGYLSPLGTEAFEPHLDFLLQLLETPDLHPTIPRSITRLFQEITLPEVYHGRIIDIAFKILSSENEHLSTRVNCMSILLLYTKIYPELSHELQLVIQEILEFKKDASIQSRGKQVLKQLKKIPS